MARAAQRLTGDRAFHAATAAVSAVALGFIAWILLVREAGTTSVDLSFMPAVNASLNTLSATFIGSGWLAIRRGRRVAHRNLMIAAFVTSALFLVGYLAYHYVHGDTRYPAEAAGRTLYLAVLGSHVLLSVAVVPLVLTTFYFALRGQFDRHRRLVKWTLPVWLYVSVTGVAIFFMLRSALGS